MSSHNRSSLLAISRRGLVLGLPALALASRAGLAAPGPDDLPRARRTVDVAGRDELEAALAEARPGDHLLLEEGSYEGRIDITTGGTRDAPIVIRSRQGLDARFGGRLRVMAPHVILAHLRFEDGQVQLAADGTRMTRCRQIGTKGVAVLVRNGRNITVDHNELSEMRGRGIAVRPEWRNPDAVRNIRIYRNYIHDFVGEGRANGHEGIQLGVNKRHTDLSLRAVAEWNLLERVNVDSEAISIKSSDNIVRFNTLLDCDGFITNRHGERNQIVANWIERSRGIVVQDRDNAVLGNMLVESRHGIRIMGGNVLPDEWPNQGSHPAALNTLVAANVTDGLTVGYLFRGHEIPATGTRLAGQDGELRRIAEAETQEVAAVSAERAVRLTAREVGPEAA